MLSAIGTISAVVLSLYLTLRESKPKLNVRISYEVPFRRWYTLVLAKQPLDTFTITGLGYYKGIKKVPYDNDLLNDTEILNSDNRSTGESLPLDFSKRSIIKFTLYDEHIVCLKGKSIRFYIEDIEGRIYKTNKIVIKNLNVKV